MLAEFSDELHYSSASARQASAIVFTESGQKHPLRHSAKMKSFVLERPGMGCALVLFEHCREHAAGEFQPGFDLL